jgi:hypothetical protein
LLVLPGKAKHVEELGQYRTSRRAQDVILAVEVQDNWGSHEKNGWEEEPGAKIRLA